MTKKILIDGLYKNNIRVAVLNENLLEEFEFEAAEKGNMRGNIYLAKVSRVENSLQAAFVDYGGEKNGFLSFSEIHPDYFQIPKEDKEKFMHEFVSLAEKDEDDEDDEDDSGHDRNRGKERKLSSLYKTYNIGEVIKKDQLLLVQVIKEERGNKGVSLTTYLSFPGKYFVLMTNTPKKIGISKKISHVQERGRIREIVDSFGISKSSGLVVRTAAENKSKEALLSDYNYLANLWNQVREKTINSKAPAFIHREESIIKRCLREFCDSEVKDIFVEGEETFDEVNMLVKRLGLDPSIKVNHFISKVPLFAKFGVESQIAALLSPKVELPSGAYFIVQQTEALVSIDVNSGKVTSEANVEETALKTNLEAAREIAKQLKLRKLAGLIVIDFIDMIRVSNRILVEGEIKKYLQKDKARIHVGRISPFGLLELSRQRTDQSIFEAAGAVCEHCMGSGYVKSDEYSAMSALRGIASALMCFKGKMGKYVAVYMKDSALLYVVNFRKGLISMLEARYQAKFVFLIDNALKADAFKIDYHYSNGGAVISAEEGAYSASITREVVANQPEEGPKWGVVKKVAKIFKKG